MNSGDRSASTQQQHLVHHPFDDATADERYCHHLARRAVARAALHYGIESMTSDCLDTVADCLLTYLQRLGSATGQTAEASKRSSMHCHVGDVLAAAELCTVRAAAALSHPQTAGAMESNGTGSDDPKANGQAQKAPIVLQGASWKDLASFCFGPDWTKDDYSDLLMTEESEGHGRMAGGKVGPASATKAKNAINDSKHGWKAPFPDEIPYFPIAYDPALRIPEPALHQMESSVTVKTHENAEDEEEQVPDRVYHVPWGDLVQAKGTEAVGEKRKVKDNEQQEQPPHKRVKFSAEAAPSGASHRRSLSFVLPTFYPPLPLLETSENRTVVVTLSGDGKAPRRAAAAGSARPAKRNGAADEDPERSVRASLVGRTAWGHGLLSVAPGRPPTSAGSAAPSIVPLTRASGSRVSRILEGSMEPSVT
jgi:Bromodomain associated